MNSYTKTDLAKDIKKLNINKHVFYIFNYLAYNKEINNLLALTHYLVNILEKNIRNVNFCAIY